MVLIDLISATPWMGAASEGSRIGQTLQNRTKALKKTALRLLAFEHFPQKKSKESLAKLICHIYGQCWL